MDSKLKLITIFLCSILVLFGCLSLPNYRRADEPTDFSEWQRSALELQIVTATTDSISFRIFNPTTQSANIAGDVGVARIFRYTNNNWYEIFSLQSFIITQPLNSVIPNNYVEFELSLEFIFRPNGLPVGRYKIAYPIGARNFWTWSEFYIE